MSPIPHLVGMVHLLPLPGSPRFAGSVSAIVDRAVSDALALRHAGFPALIVENLGDVPYHAESVPAETIAAMTIAVGAVREATGLALGVNVLRNDAEAALGIAAAVGAGFIRVNVLTGLMYTDQGPIIGRAAQLLRKQGSLAPDVEIWADVLVKHAAPPPGTDAAQVAADTVDRGLADAVIVSGRGTGVEPDMVEMKAIKEAVPEGTRVVIGSGATVDNLSRLTGVADTVIVGSSIKVGRNAHNPVDMLRAAEFVEIAKGHNLL